MAKTSNNLLVGRSVRIDFNAWTQPQSSIMPRADWLNYAVDEHSHFRGLIAYDGQTADVVDYTTDDGFSLLLADGKIHRASYLLFTVLHKVAPKPPGWEYTQIDNPALETLNRLGASGWELIAVNLYQDALVHTFKRPLA